MTAENTADQTATATQNVAGDVTGKVDLNPALAIEKIDSWIDSAVALAPNFAVAIVVFFIFYIISIIIKRITIKSMMSRQRDNLGEILGGLFKSILIILGFFVAATIVMPSLSLGDLVAGLGVSSVAIGFAFKDILQNWLAGLLILIRQPFEVGDQIVAGAYEGTVQRIETRATLIKTYDGQKAVIPNSEIYTNAVLVKTAYEMRRSQYDIGIGYGDDIQKACKIIKESLLKIEGVENTPAPEALPWDLAASWVTIRARWWSNSKRSDVVDKRAQVIMAIKYALDEAGIDMPYDTQVHLFHDQTDERDGTPGEQREGWPAPEDKNVKPRWKKEIEVKQESEPAKAEVKAKPAPKKPAAKKPKTT